MARYRLVCWQIIQQGVRQAKTVNRSWVAWKNRQNNARWENSKQKNEGKLPLPLRSALICVQWNSSFVPCQNAALQYFSHLRVFVFNNGCWKLNFSHNKSFCAGHVVVKYRPVISNVLCALLINIGRQNCISLHFLQSQLISISSRPRHYSWKWLVITTLAVQSTLMQPSTASMGN